MSRGQSSGESGKVLRDVAYLLRREGTEWSPVVRLVPGQSITIGRAPTNRIVVSDDVCSRLHCEIFLSGREWTLRDLGSRNGTKVNGNRITTDWELEEGQIIGIGEHELGFTRDPSRPFQSFQEHQGLESDTQQFLTSPSEFPPDESEPAIIHRTRGSRYQEVAELQQSRDRMSRELAKLYRLAMEMVTAPDLQHLVDVVLEGLSSGTSSNIVAILLFSEPASSGFRLDDLRVVAFRSPDAQGEQRVSQYLSRMVLEEQHGMLAHDVTGDQRLASRDSLGELHAKSLVCAPIRSGQLCHGLIHLYSTNPDNRLSPDDLEFTTAVAEQLAIGLDNLRKRQSLATGLKRARDENLSLRKQLELENLIVGESAAVRKLRENIRRIAPTDATALIRGESGVGKELVARAIHHNSQRSDHPFICMNCAALSESLLESELFGHEKGSFTGAIGRKAGKFEQAHGGTLFLDEVGEMSLSIQAKFLRVLEGHPFERVGGGSAVEVDVRVVAATNRDLEEAVRLNQFRSDLYFRLQVVEILVEPLRDRNSDIALLADFFLERFARKTNRPAKRLSPPALDALTSYDWPGNIRELQNTIERAIILCGGDVLTEDDIRLSALRRVEPDAPAATIVSLGEHRPRTLDTLEQEHILATLEWTQWNKSQAAQILGIERSTLDRKLKRYQVERPVERPLDRPADRPPDRG